MNKHKFFVSALILILLLILTAGAAVAQGPTPPGGGKPIKSITAGTGLTGGGDSGDVTLAVANTYRLPQACGNGQVPKWNGTAWICGGMSLTLPFAGTVNSSSSAFAVTNTGTGRATMFQIDNAANSKAAVSANTNGSGETVRADNNGTGRAGWFGIPNPANGSSALFAWTHGTGEAGNLTLDNPASSANAVNVYTNGKGAAISGKTDGTGRAGYFIINNKANNGNALEATTNGVGRAGYFNINNTASNSEALGAWSNGRGIAFAAYNDGTGMAGWFGVQNNPANTNPALGVHNEAIGDAISADAFGSGSVISADAKGTGRAGFFRILNSGNNSNTLEATTNGNGWAGRFTATGPGNGVYISSPNQGLNVASGTKNAVVATSNGARLLYTEESSQVWFADYGFGRLQDGQAIIAIDSLFAQTVNLDKPYHVFVQAYGDAEVYVTNRTRTGFEVRMRDGDPNAEFSYRLVALRRGFENRRLERAPWADDDPNLYLIK